MTSPIDAPKALSYRIPIGHEPLNGLVSEKFSIKIAIRQTDVQCVVREDTRSARLEHLFLHD